MIGKGFIIRNIIQLFMNKEGCDDASDYFNRILFNQIWVNNIEKDESKKIQIPSKVTFLSWCIKDDVNINKKFFPFLQYWIEFEIESIYSELSPQIQERYEHFYSNLISILSTELDSLFLSEEVDKANIEHFKTNLHFILLEQSIDNRIEILLEELGKHNLLEYDLKTGSYYTVNLDAPVTVNSIKRDDEYDSNLLDTYGSNTEHATDKVKSEKLIFNDPTDDIKITIRKPKQKWGLNHRSFEALALSTIIVMFFLSSVIRDNDNMYQKVKDDNSVISVDKAVDKLGNDSGYKDDNIGKLKFVDDLASNNTIDQVNQISENHESLYVSEENTKNNVQLAKADNEELVNVNIQSNSLNNDNKSVDLAKGIVSKISTTKIDDGDSSGLIANVQKINSGEIKSGDYVQFGKYNNEPIIWKAFVTDYDIVLISEYILCSKAYDAAESGRFSYKGGELSNNIDVQRYGSNIWSNSNIREWLNSQDNEVVFSTYPPTVEAIMDSDLKSLNFSLTEYANEEGFLYYFSDEEIESINKIKHDGVEDLIYILSEDEVLKYFGENINNRVRKYAQNQYEIEEWSRKFDYAGHYWLRSPYENDSCSLKNIGVKGEIMVFNFPSQPLGILPVLNLKDGIAIFGDGTLSNPYKIVE